VIKIISIVLWILISIVTVLSLAYGEQKDSISSISIIFSGLIMQGLLLLISYINTHLNQN